MTTEQRAAYRRYIKSDAWKLKRRAVLQRDRGRCRHCGNAGKGLEVHHLTYVRFGHELLTDLLTLCHRCHAVVHGQQQDHYHG